MKFLHAADIHLDSPLAGLRARDDRLEDVVRHSTRRAFSRMIDLALEEDVAFVVIAGDLYDGDWKDFSTGLFFAEEMRRLDRPCFLLRGNHDAKSVITRGLRLPDNVREFSSRTCETFTLAEHGVALHGHSFPNRAVPEDLSAGYPAPVAGLLNIGVLHTSCENPGRHEVYAPCDTANLRLKGYDYWALGHIHARQELSKQPWIVFPGNLQGRDVSETGAKGCTLVTMEDRQIVLVEHRPVDVLRWEALECDVTGLDEPGLLAALTGHIQTAVGKADGLPLLARVTLTGTTTLPLNDTARIAAECEAAAIEADGRIWIESVRIRTRPTAIADEDMLAPLRTAFLAGLEDPDLTAGLLAAFAALRQKVPAPGRDGLALPPDPTTLQMIATEAWQIAAAAIAATEQR